MSDADKHALINIGRQINSKGWCPATGGNFSLRSANGALMTRSRCHKGQPKKKDFLEVNGQSQTINSKKTLSRNPSPSLLISTRYGYQRSATHPFGYLYSTVTLTTEYIDSDKLNLSGFEMQKSLSSHHTYDSEINLAILDNSQYMHALAQTIFKR